jgi:hypothetical protein
MLVNVGKAVNEPEGVACTLIPSTVRLQCLDSCLRSWDHPPDFAIALAPKGVSGFADWERGFVGDFLGQRASPVGSDGEFIGEVVESGAEVVDVISENEGEPSGRLLENLNPDDILASVTLRFVDKAVRVALAPPTPFGVKAFQVLPRPV